MKRKVRVTVAEGRGDREWGVGEKEEEEIALTLASNKFRGLNPISMVFVLARKLRSNFYRNACCRI